jgi:hypothetical protein
MRRLDWLGKLDFWHLHFLAIQDMQASADIHVKDIYLCPLMVHKGVRAVSCRILTNSLCPRQFPLVQCTPFLKYTRIADFHKERSSVPEQGEPYLMNQHSSNQYCTK